MYKYFQNFNICHKKEQHLLSSRKVFSAILKAAREVDTRTLSIVCWHDIKTNEEHNLLYFKCGIIKRTLTLKSAIGRHLYTLKLTSLRKPMKITIIIIEIAHNHCE